MNSINELIKEKCPNGVEFKELGSLGKFYGGITGKSKNDFVDGNEAFITYKNVYSNLALDVNPSDRVRIADNENQRTLEYGDVVFTGSSETPDECGISSVVTEKTSRKLYLNSFCFFFRFDNLDGIEPNFMKYIFRSASLRRQIGKTANGVTRYNVSKKLMEKVVIPIPPLDVQKEIAKLLDDYVRMENDLELTLNNELNSIEKQFMFYSSSLINSLRDVSPVPLESVCEVYDGVHKTPNYTETGVKFVSVENIDDLYGSQKYISEEDYQKYKIKPQIGDVFMTRITAGIIGKCTIVDRDEPLAYYVSLALLRHKEELLPDYLKCFLESGAGREELDKHILWNATPTKINKGEIGKLNIIVPSIEKQKEIVEILNTYREKKEKLVAEISNELMGRQKQYEYYMDRLLTFKEAV